MWDDMSTSWCSFHILSFSSSPDMLTNEDIPWVGNALLEACGTSLREIGAIQQSYGNNISSSCVYTRKLSPSAGLSGKPSAETVDARGGSILHYGVIELECGILVM